MTDEKLSETIKHLFEKDNCSIAKARDILIEYKNSGGQQENAQKIMEQLRIYFVDNEVREDKVLEILDIITSWCKPSLKIWT